MSMRNNREILFFKLNRFIDFTQNKFCGFEDMDGIVAGSYKKSGKDLTIIMV